MTVISSELCACTEGKMTAQMKSIGDLLVLPDSIIENARPALHGKYIYIKSPGCTNYIPLTVSR